MGIRLQLKNLQNHESDSSRYSNKYSSIPKQNSNRTQTDVEAISRTQPRLLRTEPPQISPNLDLASPENNQNMRSLLLDR
jgi:hypothetical protein